MSNIYYSPEDFGLNIFAFAEKEPDYDFDMFVIWQNKEGELFYAEDSGCSCPSPFEDFNSADQLASIIGETGLQAFFNVLNDWKSHNKNVDTSYLRRKVREYIRGG